MTTEDEIRSQQFVVTFDDLFRVSENWLSWRCLQGWTLMSPGHLDGACKYDHNVDSWEQLREEAAEHLRRWHPHVVAALSASKGPTTDG